VIVSAGEVLRVPLEALKGSDAEPQEERRPAVTHGRYAEGERDMIVRMLREAGGVIAGPRGAAARLGLKRTTLQSKMKKLGITRPSY
jgi:formate hydrogenlyase transcriptional activator